MTVTNPFQSLLDEVLTTVTHNNSICKGNIKDVSKLADRILAIGKDNLDESENVDESENSSKNEAVDEVKINQNKAEQ